MPYIDLPLWFSWRPLPDKSATYQAFSPNGRGILATKSNNPSTTWKLAKRWVQSTQPNATTASLKTLGWTVKEI